MNQLQFSYIILMNIWNPGDMYNSTTLKFEKVGKNSDLAFLIQVNKAIRPPSSFTMHDFLLYSSDIHILSSTSVFSLSLVLFFFPLFYSQFSYYFHVLFTFLFLQLFTSLYHLSLVLFCFFLYYFYFLLISFSFSFHSIYFPFLSNIIFLSFPSFWLSLFFTSFTPWRIQE